MAMFKGPVRPVNGEEFHEMLTRHAGESQLAVDTLVQCWHTSYTAAKRDATAAANLLEEAQALHQKEKAELEHQVAVASARVAELEAANQELDEELEDAERELELADANVTVTDFGGWYFILGMFVGMAVFLVSGAVVRLFG